MNPHGNSCGYPELRHMATTWAAAPFLWCCCELQYPRFVGHQAADRVGRNMPAFGQLRDGVMLVVSYRFPNGRQGRSVYR